MYISGVMGKIVGCAIYRQKKWQLLFATVQLMLHDIYKAYMWAHGILRH